MLDSSFYVPGVAVSEEYFEVSDGVALRLVDFKPADAGENDPVILFVAGWLSLIDGWKDVLRRMTAHCRTIYIDTREKISARLPGIDGTDFSISRMCRDLGEIIEKKVAKDGKFYLAGSSLGSTVIMDYMSCDGRQPQKAFLISPIPEFNFPAWGVWIVKYVPPGLYYAVRPLIKAYLTYFRLDRKNEPEQVKKYCGTIDAAEPARLKANAYTLKDYRLWEKLPRIQTPVMIIGAKTDHLHGIEMVQKMVRLIPHAEYQLMESNRETHSEKAGELIVEGVAAHEAK